jgi:quercetin dioxygenase-like cupin family protein
MKKSNIISSLQLPFQFDEESLVKDLNRITQLQWKAHHYTMNYEGEWTSISLYAEGGDSANIFASASSLHGGQPTPVLEQCPYFKAVVGHFECPLISVRLLRLSAGSVIKPHRDFKLGYENDNFRLHVPIVTNDKVRFILNGERLEMRPGECWYTNVNFVHSVANEGSEDRIHLVIDGERNAWSDDLFFSLAPRERFGVGEYDMATDVLKRTIEELKAQHDPAAHGLIAQLERELLSRNS